MFWSIPKEGGEAKLELEKQHIASSCLWNGHLVYTYEVASSEDPNESLQVFETLDLKSGKTDRFASIEGEENYINWRTRLDVSPDGRWILAEKQVYEGTDLMLVENFH